MPPVFSDQMKREVILAQVPRRIVSLVPSQTELLHSLGLEGSVVGITRFCIHPHEWFRNKARVGGTKQVNFEKVERVQPDLIIGNKEENEQTQIDTLSQLYPVWMSDISNLTEALEMITSLGVVIDRESEALILAQNIREAFSTLKPSLEANKVLYLIWRQPYMAAAKGTFIDDMLERCGWSNALNSDRYPELTSDKIREIAPNKILLSSEPYPFKQKHIAELQELCPEASIHLVDGEMYSWYGSRMLKAPAYFQEVIDGTL